MCFLSRAFSKTTPPILLKLCIYSKDILKMVLEKFQEIPSKNKKVACRRQAMQRVCIKWPVFLFQNSDRPIQNSRYWYCRHYDKLEKCKSSAHFSVFCIDEFYTNIIDLQECLFDYIDTKYFVVVCKSNI